LDFDVRGLRESGDRIEGLGKEKPKPKFRQPREMKIEDYERVVLTSHTT
jgi:hypothetical protein